MIGPSAVIKTARGESVCANTWVNNANIVKPNNRNLVHLILRLYANKKDSLSAVFEKLEQAFQILLCPFVFWVGKDFVRRTGFCHFAEVHINDMVSETFCLTQGMCHNDDSVVFL